jgi:hypothetical protein
MLVLVHETVYYFSVNVSLACIDYKSRERFVINTGCGLRAFLQASLIPRIGLDRSSKCYDRGRPAAALDRD